MARRRAHSAPEQTRFAGDDEAAKKQRPHGDSTGRSNNSRQAKSNSRSRRGGQQEVVIERKQHRVGGGTSPSSPAQRQPRDQGGDHRDGRSVGRNAGSQAERDRVAAQEGSRERTPPVTTTNLELEELDVSGTEFVEGGVELSPSRENTPGSNPNCDRPVIAQPLTVLENRQLEEFWPPETPKALFLDYDGTLREFEMRPELATPTEELKALLRAIDDRPDVAPHVISGRDARFLETHFGHLNSFTLIAEHGYQVRRPGVDHWDLWDQSYGSHDEWKSHMRPEMQRLVEQTPGSHLEEKASSLVWHYREVADEHLGNSAAAMAIEHLRKVKERDRITAIMISGGNKVVEVSFQKARKGPVMRKICEDKALFGEPFSAVLCAGDDVSDESMFELAPSDFLTIKVGTGATLARFRAEGPELLRKLLWRLVT